MIETAEDMERALTQMDMEQREHLRTLISELIQCYLDDGLHGLVLIGRGQYDQLKMIAVNSTDMDAAALLGLAGGYMQQVTMEDAPPKEKFN